MKTILTKLFDSTKQEKLKRIIAAIRVAFYFSILLLIVITLLIVLTVNRSNVSYYKIIAVVVSCIILFFICLSGFFLHYLKDLNIQAQAINNNDSSLFIGKVIYISEKPITLSDSSKVIVIKMQSDKKQIKEFYLLSFFDNPFYLNNKYVIGVVNDFIKEFKNEE